MLKIGLQYFADSNNERVAVGGSTAYLNIQMNLRKADGTYDVLLPQTTVEQVSGTFATSQIPNLDTSKITSGTFADARIPNLSTSKITSGTFASDRIPTLSANKISAGTFATSDGEYIFPSNVRIKNNSNYGMRLNLGDGDFVYLYEDSDDNLTIKAKRIELTTTASPGVTNNGVALGGGTTSDKVYIKTTSYTGTGSRMSVSFGSTDVPSGMYLIGLIIKPTDVMSAVSTSGSTAMVMPFMWFYNDTSHATTATDGGLVSMAGTPQWSSYSFSTPNGTYWHNLISANSKTYYAIGFFGKRN